jgi:hypothetical protein
MTIIAPPLNGRATITSDASGYAWPSLGTDRPAPQWAGYFDNLDEWQTAQTARLSKMERTLDALARDAIERDTYDGAHRDGTGTWLVAALVSVSTVGIVHERSVLGAGSLA